MNAFEVGRTIRLGMNLTDLDNQPADPTGLTLKVMEPSGYVTTLTWQSDVEIVRADEGVFYVDWEIDQAGLHRYRWESTGHAQSLAESHFTARPNSF